MTNSDDLESELSELLEEFLKVVFGSKVCLCQFIQAQTSQTLYSSQITYGFTSISNRFLNTPQQLNQNPENKDSASSSSMFTTIFLLQLYIYII